jgi:hypothetical protein
MVKSEELDRAWVGLDKDAVAMTPNKQLPGMTPLAVARRQPFLYLARARSAPGKWSALNGERHHRKI